jgi:hypothetical protein
MELNVQHLSNPVTARFRRRHLHWAAAHPSFSFAVDRLFDEFFELEWTFDHRYGAAGELLASAAATLLARHGFACRVACCHAEVRQGRRAFHLGVKDWASQQKPQHHAVCLVQEELLLDFALGDVRRNFDRGFPWGVAIPVSASRSDGLVASVDIEGHGRVRWSSAAASEEQTAKGAVRLARMLREHELAFGDSASSGNEGPSPGF